MNNELHHAKTAQRPLSLSNQKKDVPGHRKRSSIMTTKGVPGTKATILLLV